MKTILINNLTKQSKASFFFKNYFTLFIFTYITSFIYLWFSGKLLQETFGNDEDLLVQKKALQSTFLTTYQILHK